MFFGVGAHCMFSNLGDGTGLMTYAPITNAFSTTEPQLPAAWQHRLRHGLSLVEQRLYGEAILEGVCFYLPAMRGAMVLGCAVGVVKSDGAVDIFDRQSGHHSRAQHGVDSPCPAFVNNAAMKLFYAANNADDTVELLRPYM